KRVNSIQSVAQKEQDDLAKVVAALKAENTDLADGIQSNLGQMRSEIATMVAATRTEQDSSAAQKVQGDLPKVLAALKEENTDLAHRIESDLLQLRNEIVTMVADTHAKQGSDVFFQTVGARQILQGASPFGAQPIAGSAGMLDPSTNPI